MMAVYGALSRAWVISLPVLMVITHFPTGHLNLWDMLSPPQAEPGTVFLIWSPGLPVQEFPSSVTPLGGLREPML